MHLETIFFLKTIYQLINWYKLFIVNYDLVFPEKQEPLLKQ